jgi:hypothetical protein
VTREVVVLGGDEGLISDDDLGEGDGSFPFSICSFSPLL